MTTYTIDERELKRIIEDGQENRYKKFGEGENHLLRAERALSKLIGTRYALGVNSGGMAMTICLLAAKQIYNIPNDGICYTNSFTFNAVPSSIVYANLRCELVETDSKLLIDLDDLEQRIRRNRTEYPPLLLLSYMRGRIPDLDKVMSLVDKYGLIVIEDAAHAYGCKWRGRMIGTFGMAGTVSTQGNKVVHSGEGGFIVTDCPKVMSVAIAASGCYESYMLKHEEFCPPLKVYEQYKYTIPNFSARMTVIQGYITGVQFEHLDTTIAKLNRSYKYLCDLPKHECIEMIHQHPQVSPVFDSLQVRLRGMSDSQLDTFLKEMNKTHKIQKFLDHDNARYYKSWRYLEAPSLPKTDKVLRGVVDMRLRADFDHEDLQALNTRINECCELALSTRSHL